ncbi:vacuolar fusion protein ccz1 [Dissophora globulifera]|uniref:Vacuolar fusion protein ccz1 n=1 Tax=Dissophora globulifera TaxID=979702 RepID=A0A9P6USP6_9FUNG|nr:vacuolar fusion protein ccz1 [Dissophora globulifera]
MYSTSGGGSSGSPKTGYVTTSPSSPASSSAAAAGPSSTPATLGYFCVYNPDYGPTDETQHEQLLYYVARKTVSMDVKMRNIGLAQGLVNFARIFSPTAPCDNVHSQKNRLVFYEAEPGYWLHLCIELGTTKRSVKGSDGKYHLVTEYLEHDIHDAVISALLQQAYAMFRVTRGTMDGLVNAHDGNTRPLQRRLEEFFEPWVLGWDFEKAMTLERALDGINYLPLSGGGALNTNGSRMNSDSNSNSSNSHDNLGRLVKSVRDKYPRLITHSMVTFEDQLVTSDIREEDLRAVWKLVVQLTGYDSASINSEWERREEEEARKKSKSSTFKFGKSWSNTSIFGFYRSSASTTTPPSTPPLRPTSRVSSPAPSIRSVDGVLPSGSSLAPGGAAGTAGSSPRPSGDWEVIMTSDGKAQLNPLWFGQDADSEDVDEHFVIIFKHKSGLNLAFFAPITEEEESQRLIDQPEQFTRELEDFLSTLTTDTWSTLLEPTDATTTTSRSLLEQVARQMTREVIQARTLGGALGSDRELRFLYFNKMTLAIKAHLGSMTGKGGGITIGSDMALSLLDIKQDFDRMPDAMEITTRSPANHWIVGKRFEDREVYMIVSRKDSTLVEVEDEVRKLTSLYFSNNSNYNTMSPSQGTPGSSSTTASTIVG